MKIKTKLLMNSSDVRILCIKQDYFTCGTNEQYGDFLDSCNGEMSNSDILQKAETIMEHSNTERIMRQYGCTKVELLESICCLLINEACYTSVEISF